MPLPIDFAKLGPQDVMDLATFVEREAQQRYELFADHLESRGERDATRFFRQMAALEGAHGEQLGRRRQDRFAGLPPHLRDAAVWDVEGPPLDRDLDHLTLSRAIERALASERRARDFFAAAMEFPVDDATRRVLGELHRDEIEHIRILEEYRDRVTGGPATS